MVRRIWPACWAASPSAGSPGGGVLGHLPGQESSPPPRAATENGRPGAGGGRLVAASRVMAGEVLIPYVLGRWVFRRGYRDVSTRPSAAGVTGIGDPRRDPGCCAAGRVDRLRCAASRRRRVGRASRARRAWPASVIRSRVCAAASCRRMSGCMVSSSRGSVFVNRYRAGVPESGAGPQPGGQWRERAGSRRVTAGGRRGACCLRAARRGGRAGDRAEARVSEGAVPGQHRCCSLSPPRGWSPGRE